jgi:hypothetical protein
MLVERVNRFLNKGLKVMTNESNSVRDATEAILLLIYAWNSARPVLGTDLPRSLIITGSVFSFPLDFAVQKHLDLTSIPATVESYAKDQATLFYLLLRTFIVPLSNTTVHGIARTTELVILCLQGVLLFPTPNVAVLEN